MLELRNTLQNILIISSLLIFIGASILCNSYLTARLRSAYAQEITAKIQQLQKQQELILQRLSTSIIATIQQQNNDLLAANLRAVEDASFTLAKNGLGVPLSVHFVSMSMPQTIISSHGPLNAQVLAPDEEYYLQVVNSPQTLNFSKAYIRLEMPDFWLLNWGMGIFSEGKFYGQLDVKSSLQALQEYLQKNIAPSHLMAFKVTEHAPWEPEIQLLPAAYWLSVGKFVLASFALWLLCLLVTIYSVRLIKLLRFQTVALKKFDVQVANLYHERQLYKNFIATQQHYAELALQEDLISVIDVQQLLNDAKTVNSILLHERKIKLILPDLSAHKILLRANKLHLMKILSSIMHECINHLTPDAKLSIDVILDKRAGGSQLEFKFCDNGFYTALTGWENINATAEAMDGDIEYLHTAYEGNVITLRIPYHAVNNVINLTDYCLHR